MAEHDYEVGYRRPPKSGRFQPGQSGNPTGKKRARKTPQDLLDRLLDEKVTVTDAGKSRRISKLELILRQLINKSAAGDARLLPLLLAHIGQPGTSDTAPVLQRDDEALIADIVASLGAQGGDS